VIREFLARRRYMREHRWTHAHLSAYLDRQLSQEERARVEAHASICPNCTRVLATLRRMLEGLHGLAGERDPGIVDGVVRRLREEG
jgi:anti-sigma factor RsiW